MQKLWFWLAVALAVRLVCVWFSYGPQSLDDYKHGFFPAHEFSQNQKMTLPNYRSPLLPWILGSVMKFGEALKIDSLLGLIRMDMVFLALLSLLIPFAFHLWARERATKENYPWIMMAGSLYAIFPFMGTRAFGEAVATDFVTLGVVVFLIFEGPTGMNLEQYLKVKPPRMYSDLYDTVYCMVKNAQVALNNAGYVHRDIKPDNIYVLLDEMGNPTSCKLIDFGFTVKKGSFVPRVGTPQYTLKDISDHLWVPHDVSTNQNDYSSDVIWTRDFKKDPASKPKCGTLDNYGGPPNANLQQYKSPSNTNAFAMRNPAGVPSLRQIPISSFKKGGKKTYKKNSKLKRTYKQRSKSMRKKL